MHLYTERFVWILSYFIQYFNKIALRLQCTIQSAINWTLIFLWWSVYFTYLQNDIMIKNIGPFVY